MARINVEDELWCDIRYMALVERIGKFYAGGAWLYCVRTAQKYWLDNRSPIPQKIWDIIEFPTELIGLGLVEKVDNGYFLCGSEKYFSWLESKSRNGRCGGLFNKNKYLEKGLLKRNEAEVKRNEAEVKRNEAEVKRQRSAEKPLALALALAPALAQEEYYVDDKSPTEPCTTKNIESGKKLTVRKKSDNIPYKQIVDYLNLKTGKKYNHQTGSTRKFISARWGEGFRMDDFEKVINFKTLEWGKTEMKKYLRPETLFGGKFDSYLNSVSEKQIKIFENGNKALDELLEFINSEDQAGIPD